MCGLVPVPIRRPRLSWAYRSSVDGSSEKRRTDAVPIIFLDFDGVIRVPPEGDEWADLDQYELGARQVRNVFELASRSGAQIVVSSDWRYGGNRSDAEALLGAELSEHLHKDWMIPLLRDERWKEVTAWLEVHSEETEYAILDTVEYLFDEAPPDMQRRLVLCAATTGFDGMVVKEAQLLLCEA